MSGDTPVTAERWAGWFAGTRVRAALDIHYMTEDAFVAEGTLGRVVENRPRGICALASVLWDGLDRALETFVENVQVAVPPTEAPPEP